MRTKKQSIDLDRPPLFWGPVQPYPALPEEYAARFDSGYRASLEPAIRAARRCGATEDDAADIVHFAICDLLARWTRPVDPAPFPKDDSHFRGTLIACIRSRAIDAKRRLETLQTTSRTGTPTEDTPLDSVLQVLDDRAATMIAGPPQFSVEEVDEVEWLHEIIWRHFKDLPPKTREVFWLFEGRGMTRAEAADWLKMKPKTVDWHHDDAIKRLRDAVRAARPRGRWDESKWYKIIEDLGRRLDERQQQRKELKASRDAGVSAEGLEGAQTGPKRGVG
jgi:RNA polymerase sigma factor (sigma-70 family)